MIQVSSLEKRYGSKRALSGVSFALGPGVTGLLGPNGAGKTTLLRCMLGIVRPSAGTVAFDSDPRTLCSEVGYLPQRYGLLKGLRVGEALRYVATLKDMPAHDMAPAIDEVLRRVNMVEHTSTKVGALSGGMLRRVGIAAALIGQPRVLVFDEPTAGLDPEERVRFKRLVTELAPDHTVLISTHIVEDIEALASRVLILDGGQIRASGTLRDIAERARGRCFLAPRDRVNEYTDDYYVDGYVDVDGVATARVLSARAYEGFAPAEPSVEDGYLCVTRGIA